MLKGKKRAGLLGFAFLTVAMLLAIRPAFAVPVTTELLLLVDVSGSIDAGEFTLQKTGYVNAFLNPGVQNLIAANANSGGIAVSLVYWSSNTEQKIAVPWTLLTDAASATAFAHAIDITLRPYDNNTAVQSALAFGGTLFALNEFDGDKLVIDISGDGVDNNSPTANSFRLGGGRASALAAGVDTINGLVIETAPAGVTDYYTNYVIGGAGGQLFAAANFDDFGAAIQKKIFFEVGGCVGDCGGQPPCVSDCVPPCVEGCDILDPSPQVPEPTTLLLMASGLSGLALFRRWKLS
jgi:hypothetical protein